VKKLISCFAVILFVISLTPHVAQANTKWTLINSNDYIFGFTSYKYSCWKGVTDKNPPIIEVFVNNSWTKAATGSILAQGSELEAPCSADFPIAVGFVWNVMQPAPPPYEVNRYVALYRERIPDTEYFVKELVPKQIMEIQQVCCEVKTLSKRVPYIAKVKKNGKFTNVIKYKSVTTQEQVTYEKPVLVEKNELVDVRKTSPGWIGQPGNISIYSSQNAMLSQYRDLANALACGLGSPNCKKK
jgi:hypothetical protein